MDLHALQKRQAFRPAAPSNISKEHQGIWDAWTFKSDREVAREAAAKGHVSLAIQFLSVRKNIRQDQSKDFINSEVFKWVADLLDRKQIFRVSHILTNVGIDPGPELITVFCDTDKKYLRDYIGDYLIKTGQLNAELQDFWYFLEAIFNNNLFTISDRLRQDSVRCLQETSDTWKHEVAGKLFLRTQDLRLMPFLNAEVLWKLLLLYNNVNLLKTWIALSFSNQHQQDTIVPDGFLQIFKLFPITDDMLNDVLNHDCSSQTQDDILNEFCKYGKFSKHDLTNVVHVLKRVNQSDNLLNIYTVLNQRHSNLPLDKFTELLVEYCLDNNLLTVLNHCTSKLDISRLTQTNDSLDLRLLRDMRNLVPNFDGSTLCDSIFYVAKYLSKTSLGEYFCDHPILFLSLLIFSKNLSVIKTMKEKSLVVQNVDLFDNLEHLMDKSDVFRNIYNNKIGKSKIAITYYDLALRHLNVNIKELYTSGDNKSFPNFCSPDLVRKYGYQKKINYIFYIKECRPSIAYQKFLELDNRDSVQRKIAKLGILNFENAAVMAASIAFSEMAGLNSDFLRVCFKSVKIIKEAGVDANTIKALFLKVNDRPSEILDVLEPIVVEQIDVENLMLGVNFVDAVKSYEVVFRFCVICKLPFPEMFLKQCASLNLWWPFVLYAQLKNYPTAQIKALVPNFKNPNLVEHIVHSVIHDIQLEDLDVLKGERDSRKYYLSRVGVRLGRDHLNAENLSYSSVSLASSQGSSVDSLEIDVSNVKTTLLQTLIRCHNSTDPPRALLQACQLYKYPFLAIVASCYEPDSVITYWIAWLSVSTDMYEMFTSFEALTISGTAVTNFLIKCMDSRYPKTLLESFIIFIPDNPLRYFTEFLNLIIFKNLDTSKLKSILSQFSKTKNQRRGSIFSDKDYEMLYIKNKLWIETTSLKLLASVIAFNLDSTFEKEEFVEILCELDIQNYFDYDTPNFNCLLKILKIISEAKVALDVCKFFDNENYMDAYQKCIDDLIDKKLFEEALNIAHCAEINTDSIILKKWKEHLIYDIRSLNDCDLNFQLENVSSESVVKFYTALLAVVIDQEDKYQLLKLAYKWTKLNTLSNQHELENQMILMFLSLGEYDDKIDELTEFDEEMQSVSFQEMTHKIETINTIPENLSDDITEKVVHLIDKALDTNNLWLALKLEKIFGHKSCDLTILKTCHKLAEKIITPDHLDKEQKSLLSKVKYFRRISGSSDQQDAESDTQHPKFLNSESAASHRQILAMIHCLVEKLEHGSELGRRIMRMYRMSINIDVPYYVIVSETDHMKMLKLALDEDCSNKLEVVHDFVMVFKPSSEQVADLLSGEIISASSDYVKSKTDKFAMWDLDMNTQFHLVLQLLRDDCSILGHKLYNYANVLHKAQLPNEFDFRIGELALVVEMLIAAHHCFTADCNMDGISMVLRKNCSLISHLLTLRSWKLIVRLFIGTGRFSEMNYVFHILKEHEQFEYLLRKGSRKDDRLKESLLEYIRRFCPDNTELYKMAALHFTLYSEVAELWEKEAEHLVKDLIAIAKLEMENDGFNPENEPFVLFVNSAGTEKYLDKILENYAHATEFHMQGEKLTRAMNSVKKGELFALQKSLLKCNDTNISTTKAICLLNLSASQITYLISTKLSFSQSYILVQAYNFMPDWASVIYEQCISQDNSTYLTDYISLLPLNESVVQDISRKFMNANVNTPKEIQNMKSIVSKLVSVHAKYRIASELGFTDLVEELLDKGQLAYLKDTVWKKGYRGGS